MSVQRFSDASSADNHRAIRSCSSAGNEASVFTTESKDRVMNGILARKELHNKRLQRTALFAEKVLTGEFWTPCCLPRRRSLATEPRHAQAAQVAVTDGTLIVELVDGRTVSVPLAWYPRLAHGTPADRSNWHLIGRGEGIHCRVANGALVLC